MICAACGHDAESHEDDDCFQMIGFAHRCECSGLVDPDDRTIDHAVNSLRALLAESPEMTVRISRRDATLFVEFHLQLRAALRAAADEALADA